MSGILAFDTSNYTTSAAYLDLSSGRGANVSRLLPVREGALGLRQSDAVFAHVRQMPEVMHALSERAEFSEPAFFAASRAPRAAEGSYMPCFLVGMTLAESMACAKGQTPFYFSHQQGHIAAAVYSAGRMDLLEKPFLAWHLSGGTTELLLVEPDEERITRETILGGTTDISAGQLIDRAGVLLGLGFPCGKALSALADEKPDTTRYKVKVQDMRFSLSGMENKVEAMKKNGAEASEIANFALNTVICAVEEATRQALAAYPGLPVLCSGGVASNTRFRAQMEKEFSSCFALPALSTDNAMGVAVLAAIRILKEIPKWTKD